MTTTTTTTTRSAWLLLCAATAALTLILATTASAASHNITEVLSGLGDYSLLRDQLVRTGVAYEINIRSSITVLAPRNEVLAAALQAHPPSAVADVLRYHVCLQYMDPQQMRASTSGTTVATLFQTTGRAVGDGGIVDVVPDAVDGTVRVTAHGAGQQQLARIGRVLSASPYNLTVYDVSEVMVPAAGLAQAGAPPVNLTDVLVRAGGFGTALGLLRDTGVAEAVQRVVDAGAGVTLFLPNDTVWARTFTRAQLDALSAAQKTALLQYHAVPAYYPIDFFKVLDAATTLPTLASSSAEADDYVVSVNPPVGGVGGKVFVGTGIVSAAVADRAVYQDYPTAVFEVDNVLLPKEIFTDFPESPALAPDTAAAGGPESSSPLAQPPVASTSPPSPPPVSAPAAADTAPALPPTTTTTSPPPAIASPPPAAASPPPATTVTPAKAPTTPKRGVPAPAPGAHKASHPAAASGPGPSSSARAGGPASQASGAAGASFSLPAAVLPIFSSVLCAATWIFVL